MTPLEPGRVPGDLGRAPKAMATTSVSKTSVSLGAKPALRHQRAGASLPPFPTLSCRLSSGDMA